MRSDSIHPLSYERHEPRNPPVRESRVPAVASSACCVAWWMTVGLTATWRAGADPLLVAPVALLVLLTLGSIAVVAAWLHDDIPWSTWVATALVATCWLMSVVLLVVQFLKLFAWA